MIGMQYMFNNAEAFRQELSSWKLPNRIPFQTHMFTRLRQQGSLIHVRVAGVTVIVHRKITSRDMLRTHDMALIMNQPIPAWKQLPDELVREIYNWLGIVIT